MHNWTFHYIKQKTHKTHIRAAIATNIKYISGITEQRLTLTAQHYMQPDCNDSRVVGCPDAYLLIIAALCCFGLVGCETCFSKYKHTAESQKPQHDNILYDEAQACTSPLL